jgi:hypothetical protein
MNSIKIEMHKCDILAARYYNLAVGDRERAARDWFEQVEKTAKLVQAKSIKPNMDRK